MLGLRPIVAALGLLLSIGPVARAQSDSPGAKGDKIVELRQNWIKQTARQDVANLELNLLVTDPRSGKTVANLGDPNDVLRAIGPVLTDDYVAIANGLLNLETKARARLEEVQKDWAEACRQRAAFRQYADNRQSVYGFNFDAGTPPGLNPDVLDLILLAWGLAVFVLALRLRANEQRLGGRKSQRVAAAGAILLAIAFLPGCNQGASASRSWTEREQDDLTATGKDAADKADAAVIAANNRWQLTVDGWTRLVRPEGRVKEDTPKVDETVQEQEVGKDGMGIRDRLRSIAVQARLSELMVKDAEDLRNQLAGDKAKLDDLVASSRLRATAMTMGRTGLAVVLFGLTISPFWSARRARRAAIRLASRTCPRCFRRDTLRVERTGGAAESKPARRGKAKPVEAPDREEQEDAEARCTKCGLRMRKSYLKVPRLCFPTVGVRSSGKTHMLVTAYDRIRKRTAPTYATVQPAPSGGDIDKRYDYLIETILHRRGEAGATDLVLPDPILVHLKDRDPAGANPALINLFDYSGELINPDYDLNQLKATAVRMDGFMLFLDPTQLYGDGANVSLDEQLGMLDRFLEHMRRERKVPVGGSIPVPVAVCIPKFDLLLSDNPIGGQSVPFIRHLLQELNPPPREMTLEIVQARSDLVEEMLPLMFTGANVREIVEGYFGKQVMFFPMSAVGLFEHELGMKDLSKRNIAPFGVAEPLIWLMHMHGYEVLG